MGGKLTAVHSMGRELRFWFVTSEVTLVPNLNLGHMYNARAVFSMISLMLPTAFVALSIAVSAGIGWWLRAHPVEQRLVASGLALILGGALGNATDRIRFGYVVDFVDFYVGNWHFAAFNVADSAITVGAGLLILDMLLDGRRPKTAAI